MRGNARLHSRENDGPLPAGSVHSIHGQVLRAGAYSAVADAAAAMRWRGSCLPTVCAFPHQVNQRNNSNRPFLSKRSQAIPVETSDHHADVTRSGPVHSRYPPNNPTLAATSCSSHSDSNRQYSTDSLSVWLTGRVGLLLLLMANVVADVVSRAQRLGGVAQVETALSNNTSRPSLAAMSLGALGRQRAGWCVRWIREVQHGQRERQQQAQSRDLTAMMAALRGFSASSSLHAWCERTNARAAAAG